MRQDLKPIVSIITANYNKGEVVVECVRSVCDQTVDSWELIFVDDGSDDGSFEMAKDAANGDERCVFLENTTGIKGANAARNMAIDLAKGEFVIFLDSDDILTPDCVAERLSDFEKYPEMDLLIYPMGLFNKELGDSEFISNIPTEESDLNRFLNRDIVWLISGPTWRKEALKSLGGFDLSLHSQQDYDLHIRALIKDLKYTYFHTKPDVYYRRDVVSIPRQTSQTIEHFRRRFEMILRHQSLLEAAGKMDHTRRELLARYLLDLAQMMRWHISSLGKEALNEGLDIWKKSRELDLVDSRTYKTGIKYIRFKHTMIYNRFPKMQERIEAKYQKKLKGYIFNPSKTYCKTTLADYNA